MVHFSSWWAQIRWAGGSGCRSLTLFSCISPHMVWFKAGWKPAKFLFKFNLHMDEAFAADSPALRLTRWQLRALTQSESQPPPHVRWPTFSLNQCLVFSSGVSVGPRTSSVGERRVVLLLLPGQPQSRHRHGERGLLPFSSQQPSTRGAAGTGWVHCKPPTWLFVVSGAELMRLEFNYCFELFNFGTAGFGCCNEINFSARVFLYVCVGMTDVAYTYTVQSMCPWMQAKLIHSFFKPAYTARSNLYFKAHQPPWIYFI